MWVFYMFQNIVSFIFPNYIFCTHCQINVLHENEYLLCDACYTKLLLQKNVQYFIYQVHNNALHTQSVPGQYSNYDVIGFFPYSTKDSVVRSLILSLKYNSNLDCAKILANTIAHIIASLKFDYIIPIPSSLSNLDERRFNQMEVIAKELSAIINKPYLCNILYRKHDNAKQMLLGKVERFHNVKDNFECNENLQGKTILLLDDVITTGATSYHCKNALVKKGAQVIVACIAYA